MEREFSLSREWRQKLWSQHHTAWLDLIQSAPSMASRRQNIRAVVQGGITKITMPCFDPAHNDTGVSAAVHLTKGFANCLGGSCHAHSADPVSVISGLYGVTYQQAFQILLTQFKLKPGKDMVQHLGDYERMQRMLTAFHNASQQTLRLAHKNVTDPAYASFVPAVTYLIARGVDIDLAANNGIGLFPRYKDYYGQLAQEDRAFAKSVFHNDFVYDADITKASPYEGWLTFQYEFALGQYGKFKIRNVDPRANKSHRQMWFGPNTKNNFFGLSSYRTVYATCSSATGGAGFDITTVEGEFDAFAPLQYQVHTRNAVEKPFVCGSGGAVGDVSALSETGADRVVLLPDNDAGGVGFVTNGLAQQESTDAIVIYEYDDAVPDGADPFDMLMRGPQESRDSFFESFHVQSENIIQAHEWLGNRFEEEWRQLINPTTQQELDVVKRYSKFVKGGVGADIFLDRVSVLTEYPTSTLRTYALDVVTNDRDFRLLLEMRLAEEFEPLIRRGNVLQCYGRRKRSTFDLRFGNAIETAVDLASHALNAPMTEWVEEVIGCPSFITEMQTKGGDQPRPYGDQLDIVRRHMHGVVTDQLIAKTPVQENVRVLKQGVHVMRPEEFNFGSAGDTFFNAHIINGHVHLRGRVEPGAEEKVDWHIYDNAKPYEGSVFIIGGEAAWSDTLLDEGFVGAASPMSEGADAFARLSHFFDTGWTFDDQKYVPMLLAAHAMTAIIHQFGDSCPMFHFTGKTQAGKTSLTKGALRGEIFNKRFWLTEHYTGIDAYSAAAVWQKMEGDARIMCLDEFEDADDGRASRKNAIVTQVYEDLRNVQSGMTLQRGGPNGSSKEYYLRTGLTTAGINPIKREVDANRYLSIRLCRQTDKTPYDALDAEFTREEVTGLRRICTLFSLKHANGILGEYQTLKKTLKPQIRVKEDRVLHRIFLPLALMSYIGVDIVPVAQAIVDMHENNMSRTVNTEEATLYSAIFETPALNYGDDIGRRYTLRELLHDTQRRAEMSAYFTGAFVIGDAVFLHMPTIHRTILRFNDVYRKTENALTLHDRILAHVDAEEVTDVHLHPELYTALQGKVDTRPAAKTRLVCLPLTNFISETKG